MTRRREVPWAGASRATLLLVVLLALAAPSLAHAAAGTNIGDASPLTGTQSATLPTALADDWYVIYPSSSSDQITVTVKNTTETGAGVTCTGIVARFTDSSGQALNSQDISAGASYNMFSGTGQDRYFVEINDGNCNPGTGTAPAYTVHATGPSGTSLKGQLENAPTGGSIGDARTGMDGHVAYQGSITSGSVQQWLVFQSGSTSPVSIRVENTTPLGTSNCTPLIVGLTDTFGRAINSQDVDQNRAYTFTVNTPGRYFVRLQDNNCDPPSGMPVNYDVQLDPMSGVRSYVPDPQQPIQGGVSQSAAAGPVGGGIDYTDTIPDATTTKWYAVRVNGTAYLTVENTSPFRSPCGSAVVRLLQSDGTTEVNGQDLSDDTGYTFDLTAGTFYLTVSDNGCDPDTGSPLALQFNVSPVGAVVPGQGFGAPPPPVCQNASATVAQGQPASFALSCSGGTAPLTYQVLLQPANGQVNVNAQTGAATYTPRSTYTGSDSFTFNVGDATGAQSAVATATITVTLATGVSKTGPGTGGSTPPGGTGTKPTGKGTTKKKTGKGTTKNRKTGKTPNKSWLPQLNANIAALQKQIPELDKLKNIQHGVVSVYESLSDLVLKHPVLKKTPGLEKILKIARDAVDLFIVDKRDYVDQVDATAHKLLAAYIALRDGINHPKGKDLAKLNRNVTTAGKGGASEATKLKQLYDGFAKGINTLTDELAKDPSIEHNIFLKGGVKLLKKYMDDALKQLEKAAEQQNQVSGSK